MFRKVNCPLFDQATYWLSVIAWAAVLLTTILRAVMLRRERSNGDELRDPNRPPGDIFRGVTLISDKFKKRTNEPVAPTKVIHAERTPMAQFETKIKPLETAAWPCSLEHILPKTEICWLKKNRSVCSYSRKWGVIHMQYCAAGAHIRGPGFLVWQTVLLYIIR